MLCYDGSEWFYRLKGYSIVSYRGEIIGRFCYYSGMTVLTLSCGFEIFLND